MSVRLLLTAVLVLGAVVGQAGTGLPVGSLVTTGNAKVSGIAVPNGTAVFAGDTIENGAGSSVFTSRRGDSITLLNNARVKVGEDQAELLSGMSRLQARSREVTITASEWKLEARPDAKTGVVTADVVRGADGMLSINVKEGQVVARSQRGVTLVAAGRPVLLPNAAAPPAGPGPQQQPAGARSRGDVVGAYILGAAAVAIGAAVLATRDDNEEEIRELQTQLQQLQGSLTALQNTITALQAQVNTLNATITALRNQINTLQLGEIQRNALIQQLAALTAQLAADQARLAQLLAISQTRALTPEEQGELSTISSRLSSITQQILTIIQQLQNQTPTTPSNP